jgi:hypothetical protein
LAADSVGGGRKASCRQLGEGDATDAWAQAVSDAKERGRRSRDTGPAAAAGLGPCGSGRGRRKRAALAGRDERWAENRKKMIFLFFFLF